MSTKDRGTRKSSFCCVSVMNEIPKQHVWIEISVLAVTLHPSDSKAAGHIVFQLLSGAII